MIDLHCHILPGLDDGPKTMEESLEMCRIAVADGIHTIIATPHRRSFVANTTAKQVFDGVKQLNELLNEQQIPLKVLPGHEVHITEDLLDDVNQGESLTINNNKKYILLELPFRSVPFYVFDIVARLKERGITPIIAHPERISQIQTDMRIMQKLIFQGALSQITGGSLLGEYGLAAKNSATDLLKHGLVHIIASDAHSTKRTPVISTALNTALKILDQANNNTALNSMPAQIITNSQ